jgi:hypothetical protein
MVAQTKSTKPLDQEDISEIGRNHSTTYRGQQMESVRSADKIETVKNEVHYHNQTTRIVIHIDAFHLLGAEIKMHPERYSSSQ